MTGIVSNNLNIFPLIKNTIYNIVDHFILRIFYLIKDISFIILKSSFNTDDNLLKNENTWIPLNENDSEDWGWYDDFQI